MSFAPLYQGGWGTNDPTAEEFEQLVQNAFEANLRTIREWNAKEKQSDAT